MKNIKYIKDGEFNMKKKDLILFIIIFSIVFIYNFFISSVFSDEIWNYGVAYNISKGMIPYRDFNLVTTPLYPMMASTFIKIFGNFLYSFHIFNSIIVTIIIIISYKKLGKNCFLVIPFILLNSYPSYNILCVLFIFILFLLVDYNFKYRDALIGILIGCMFLTKQTVGICLFVPMIYYSKSRLKSFISFMIPIFLFIIYLLWNSGLYKFLDYCFWGLFDFGNSNSILIYLPFEIIVVFILCYKLFCSKFCDEKYFYVLMFQVITIPILDDYHFIVGFIPCLYLFLESITFVTYRFKYYLIMIWFLCVFSSIKLNHYHELHYILDKNSYLYGRNVPTYVEKSLYKIGNYINDNKDDFDYVYFFSANAYWVKLNINYPITKYDMICNGNIGYKGDFKYIDEVNNYCSSHRCMFVLYKYEYKSN